MDRYQLARDFNLNAFERQVLGCHDVAELQNLCIKLNATISAQQQVYESLLRDTCPEIPQKQL